MDQMPCVCGIVVSWNPNQDIVANVAAIAREVRETVVIDNGSTREEAAALLLDLAQIPRVSVIRNQDNLGIAAALNTGIRYAISRNYDWVATFDQDSRPGENYVHRMLEAYGKRSQVERIGIIAPAYMDAVTGWMTYHGTKTTLTSGNLVRMDVFSAVGMFREDFFIDYVDFEFCLRCAQSGYTILEVTDAILHHRLGDSASFKRWGVLFHVTNHPPLRLYYRARNRLAVYKLYFRREPRWVAKDIRALASETLKVLLFEKQCAWKLSLIVKGIWHGLFGRMGKATA